jgi:hypothetical protein
MGTAEGVLAVDAGTDIADEKLVTSLVDNKNTARTQG